MASFGRFARIAAVGARSAAPVVARRGVVSEATMHGASDVLGAAFAAAFGGLVGGAIVGVEAAIGNVCADSSESTTDHHHSRPTDLRPVP
eukprot:CAMPEP_0206492610 /NCGR_PEP_ID=MMETSP0324_2-20121206/46244_1 /ASSEMBLY_ACC=CAM_ASM_000836 /TAXON_ID=2866 /ORGANISM="Crypthecodinium cohnii, Strain Seligo" /LENGTH=89 /DNA_ID=CAMNT_0053975125 /DNA_START=169 /DNA_END=435 /DNA_ORIENTATION=-